MRNITLAECSDTLDCEPEFTNPEDDFFDDSTVIDNIKARLEKGDFGAWCILTVKMRWNEFTGTASLGGFSFPKGQTTKENLEYASEEFKQLKFEALAELNESIQRHCNRADELRSLLTFQD